MSAIDPTDVQTILERIRAQAVAGAIRLSVHARQEMVDDTVTRDDILEVLAVGRVLENYPTYHKGACCLVYGDTGRGRPLHIVCSTTLPELVIITVYEPTLPKWASPARRS
jgi:hypothetical protein